MLSAAEEQLQHGSFGQHHCRCHSGIRNTWSLAILTEQSVYKLDYIQIQSRQEGLQCFRDHSETWQSKFAAWWTRGLQENPNCDRSLLWDLWRPLWKPTALRKWKSCSWWWYWGHSWLAWQRIRTMGWKQVHMKHLCICLCTVVHKLRPSLFLPFQISHKWGY